MAYAEILRSIIIGIKLQNTTRIRMQWLHLAVLYRTGTCF